jgi:peptide/nickel transport system permease protein
VSGRSDAGTVAATEAAMARTDPPARPDLQDAALLAPRPSLLRRLVRDRIALLGLLILLTLGSLAVLAPWTAPYDPAAQDVLNRFAPSSSAHLLGTDHLGRDELSRLLYGARMSLLTALALGTAILLIGTAVGLLAGFAGGWVDGLLMRLVDVLLAFPNFLLVLVVVAALGPGLVNLAIAFLVAGWVSYARLVRGLVLSAKQRPYIEAARALGFGSWRIALRHLLPNVVAPVVVLWTLRTGQLLLALAALSFLGLGAQPPTAEWGAMLNEARDAFGRAPQLMIYPGVAITLAVLGFNLLGDGFRDVLDPTLR